MEIWTIKEVESLIYNAYQSFSGGLQSEFKSVKKSNYWNLLMLMLVNELENLQYCCAFSMLNLLLS